MFCVRQTYEKTVPIGQKLDVVFHLIRMGLFYLDYDLAKRNIAKAKTLIEEGGDWDRRNRLKVTLNTTVSKIASNCSGGVIVGFSSISYLELEAVIRYKPSF